ncbi:Fic family protein [Thiopseudomonas acetoxidans]|uniref:Filamentation induced by cAMP protein Fic-like C-terminal domain-containing protein n=1 Tax=Thiopseudomonas acetoxidans TaxID=3041622 RepID=A0ABT7SL24_9GAMM|nr:hypothetical protein [Thiopseudomonas sp. CY1220]MDM7856878.1 hypothetical protein [Thiopseudomonas sp. CY1220]
MNNSVSRHYRNRRIGEFLKELIEMTQPDSPRSPTQKYRLTQLGKQVLAVNRGE